MKQDYTNIDLVGRCIYFRATTKQKEELVSYLTPEKLYKIVEQLENLITVKCNKGKDALIYFPNRDGHLPEGCKWILANSSTVAKALCPSSKREVQL